MAGITRHINMMNLLMTISSAILWRTALDAESSLLFTPWKAPYYLLRFITMTAMYCFLSVAFYLCFCISTQIINTDIFTEFWLDVTMFASFVLFGALSIKVSNWVKYSIVATPEMRSIFPDGDKFPEGESATFGCIGWVVHIFLLFTLSVLATHYFDLIGSI